MNDRILLAAMVLPAMIVILRTIRRDRQFRWVGIAALVFVLLPWAMFTRMFNRVLEAPYTQGYPAGTGEAMVLLAGTIEPQTVERPVDIAGGNTYQRAFYAAWLYKHWQAMPILVCGGPDRVGGEKETPYSHVVREVLIHEGIPEAQIWTEDRSQNTYENALYGSEILRAKNIHRVVLVTEAYHMMRSERCFRKLGIEVVPAPLSFRSRFQIEPWHILLPGIEDIDFSFEAIHEMVGLASYAIRGRI